jgi:drug/metabolite transporter (DMT)-like permease
VLALVAALSASLMWGVSDFLGGLATRTMGVLRATTVSYVAATVVLVVAAVIVPGHWSALGLGSGLVAAVGTMVGFLTFYAALADGPMGVVSAGVALGQSMLPVVVAVGVRGDRLSGWAWVGILAAVGGGLLLGRPVGGQAVLRPRVVALTAVSGASFGVAVVALDTAPDSSGLLPAAVEGGVGLLMLLALGTCSQRWSAARGLAALIDPGGPPGGPGATTGRSQTAMALASGVVLGLANAVLIFALRNGRLAVVAVVIALYPLATAILARVVLGERLHRSQVSGIAVAMAACALLAMV